MPKKIQKIIQSILNNNNINKLQETEKEIRNLLGESFLKKQKKKFFLKKKKKPFRKKFFKKHTKNIFLEKEKVVVEVKTIEAKTELNIIKKNFNTKLKLI